ncbi:5669_t:CDS:1, partial [Dentiscutata heterogama]
IPNINTSKKKKFNKKQFFLLQDTIKLSKILQNFKDTNCLTTSNQKEVNDTIKRVNERQETSIPLIKDVTDTETINDIKGW